MVYPNYYAKRWAAQTAWRRPANLWQPRRQGYGYQHATYRWPAGRQQWSGYRTIGRTWPRYGAGASHARRWSWLRGQRYGYSPQVYGYAQSGGYAPQTQTAPPQWVAWVQGCLAQILGAGVPQTGVLGRATRHAIRKFQKQQQLPPSGMLDAATINALQAACSGQGGSPMGAAAPSGPPAPPPPPAIDDVAAASAAASGGAPPEAPPPDAGGAPSDGGAPPPDASAGGAPPDAASGELFVGGRNRHRRHWGRGFNFQPPSQPSNGDDSDELFVRGRRRRHGHRWAGLGYQPPDTGGDNDDDGELFMGRHRRFQRALGGGYQSPDDGDGSGTGSEAGRNRWPRRRW